MELRDHPLLSFGGHHSWPPAWTWIGGKSDKYLTGEIGVLKELRMPESPAKKFYMIIEYEESLYMGCLLTREPAFCGQIFTLLQDQRGRSIQSIGSLDVTHLL